MIGRVEAAVPDGSDDATAAFDVRMFSEDKQLRNQRFRPIQKTWKNASRDKLKYEEGIKGNF